MSAGESLFAMAARIAAERAAARPVPDPVPVEPGPVERALAVLVETCSACGLADVFGTACPCVEMLGPALERVRTSRLTTGNAS